MNKDWLYASATRLAKDLRAGKISSRELLETCLARVNEKNPGINAVVATDLEGARRQADAADQALARGDVLGPLHGLPVTAKDTWEVPGMPCTAGAPRYRNHVPQKPATAIQRMQDAGAIIFGKTNVPLFASDLQSYNALYGTTRNPWDFSRTPGGSSGGAAAALAAGFTPLELGSDVGGSIRIPAHFCGVYGHKVTQGIIPMRGHIPAPPGTLSEPDLAVAGPMARHAEDLALLLDVVAGPSPLMQPGWTLDLPDASQTRVQDFRVLLWLDDPLCPIDAHMAQQYSRMADALAAAGVSVTYGSPLGMSLEKFYPGYMNLLGSAMGNSRKPMERRLMGLAASPLKKIGPWIKAPKMFEHLMQGAAQSHADWQGHSERRYRLREKFLRVFEQYDVVLMPATAAPAIPHDQELEMPLRRIVINGEKRSYTELFMWIAPATLMGLPATSAPIGVTPGGLPVNVQIMGAPFQDKTTIRFAELLSGITGGFTPPPGY